MMMMIRTVMMMTMTMMLHECCFRPRFCTCKAILGRGQPGLLRSILLWIMPLAKDHCTYHPTLDAPYAQIKVHSTGISSWSNLSQSIIVIMLCKVTQFLVTPHLTNITHCLPYSFSSLPHTRLVYSLTLFSFPNAHAWFTLFLGESPLPAPLPPLPLCLRVLTAA